MVYQLPSSLSPSSEIQDYILFTTDSKLHQVSLDTPVLADITSFFTHFRAASSVDVDIVHNEIYWTEKLESKIFKAPLSGGQPPQAMVSLDLITPEAIAVDWIGRTMYWADSGTGFIEVSDLNVTTRRVLVTGLVQVISLALDVVSR